MSLLATEGSLLAQASVNVTTLDTVYRDIDKLVAHGLVKKIIVGQRPYSRKEVARITAEALHHLPRLEAQLQDPKLSENKKQGIQDRLDYLHPMLERLKRDYHEELVEIGALPGEKYKYSWHLTEKVTVDLTGSNSPSRPVPNNGLGTVDAMINPLLQYQQGRHIIEGTNLSLETSHWARLTNYFAFYFQPRFQMAMAPDDGQSNDNKVYVNNLYGKFYYNNFEVQAGRDNVMWGQGYNAGLLFSNNPRGFDMVKLSNDSPLILPWVFKYLGAHKFSFFYTDLGPGQNFPHAYITALKWSWEPISFFEFGLSYLVESGGEGGPPASFGTRVANTFHFTNELDGQDLGNKQGVIDVRFRIPPLRGAEIYAEFLVNDQPGSITDPQFLEADTSMMGGIYVPRLINSGELDLRFEYHRTGTRCARHGNYSTGLALNQFLMGDNLGPEAQGAYLTSGWDINPANLLTFNAAFESRSGDLWGVNPGFTFVVIQNNPSENRYRGAVEWLHRFTSFPLDVKLQAAYERVNNFNFVSGDNRNNFLGALTFQFNFDQWTRSLKN